MEKKVGNKNSEGTALGALIMGILSLVLFGYVFGPLAVVLGIASKRELEKENKSTTVALVAITCGIVAMVFEVLALMGNPIHI